MSTSTTPTPDPTPAMADHRPLIAMISATTASIGPATAAFAEEFPQARLWNVLDDRLQQDAAERGSVDEALAARMGRLVEHAVTEGARGILLTCSLYGPLVESLAPTVPVPLLAPDGAAFADALSGGHRRILLIASAREPLGDSSARFQDAAARVGHDLAIDGVVAAGAATAALAGDVDALVRFLRTAVDSRPRPDAVLLAQYSLAPAAEQLAAATGLPVYAGPRGAARRLRAELLGAPS